MTYSVMMIRDADQLIPAKYVCQFFKLCGIYVYDYAMPQHAEGSGLPDCFGFDCVMLMTRQNNAKTVLNTYSNQSIVEFPILAGMDLSSREKKEKNLEKKPKRKFLRR